MCRRQEDAADLRAPLGASKNNGPLHGAFEANPRKPKGHDFVIDRDKEPLVLGMSMTGESCCARPDRGGVIARRAE